MLPDEQEARGHPFCGLASGGISVGFKPSAQPIVPGSMARLVHVCLTSK